MSCKKDLTHELEHEMLANNLRLLLNHHNSTDLRLCLLNKAANCDDQEMIDLLLNLLELIKLEINDNIENHLEVSVAKGNMIVTKFLLKKGAKLEASKWKNAGFVAYCIFTNKSTRKEMLELLLKNGLDVGIKSFEGNNLLHLFIRDYADCDDQDQMKITELLITSGLPINESGDHSWNPIDFAVERGNKPLTELLINLGAIMSNSLLFAADNGDTDIVDLLLSNGAEVRDEDSDGNTALHMACCQHNKQMINLLIYYGAEVNALNNQDQSPFTFLDSNDENFVECMIPMMKEYSKLSFKNFQISMTDYIFIAADIRAREYFEKCENELKFMSSAIFHERYSYYAVLSKSISIKKLSKLMKNQELVTKFEADLTKFTFYESDLKQVLNEAIKMKEESIIVESRLKCILSDHLPGLVIKKLAGNLKAEDLLSLEV